MSQSITTLYEPLQISHPFGRTFGYKSDENAVNYTRFWAVTSLLLSQHMLGSSSKYSAKVNYFKTEWAHQVFTQENTTKFIYSKRYLWTSKYLKSSTSRLDDLISYSRKKTQQNSYTHLISLILNIFEVIYFKTEWSYFIHWKKRSRQNSYSHLISLILKVNVIYTEWSHQLFTKKNRIPIWYDILRPTLQQRGKRDFLKKIFGSAINWI